MTYLLKKTVNTH